VVVAEIASADLRIHSHSILAAPLCLGVQGEGVVGLVDLLAGLLTVRLIRLIPMALAAILRGSIPRGIAPLPLALGLSLVADGGAVHLIGPVTRAELFPALLV
jgi:hypothetical protein